MAEGIFHGLAKRIQLRKNSPPVEKNISSPIDLRERVQTGGQPIAIDNTVFLIKAVPNAAGNEPKFFIKEINPDQSLGGSVRIVNNDGSEKFIRKEVPPQRGGLPTYRVTLETGNTTAVVGPMDKLVEVPKDGKIVLVPSTFDKNQRPQEIPIHNWVLTPQIQTGPGK